MESSSNLIVALKTKIENDLKAVGTSIKIIKPALLALEDILLVLFSEPECTVNKCDLIRNTNECAISLVCSNAHEVVKKLDDPSEAFILKAICKKFGFSLKVSEESDSVRLHFLLEKFHPFRDNIRFALNFLGDDKKQLYIAIAYHIVSIILNLILPILSGKMIVYYTDKILAQVILMAVVILLCRMIYAYTFHWASIKYTTANFKIERNLYTRLLEDYFKIKNEDIEEAGSGTFVQRITEDTHIIADGLCYISSMSSDFLYYVGVMIASLAISPIVFLAEVLVFAGLFFLERRRGFILDVNNRKTVHAADIRTGITIDFIHGMQEVKLLNSKLSFTKRINEAEDEYKCLEEFAYTCSQKREILHDIYTAAGYTLIMIYLGMAIQDGSLTVPETLVLYNYYSIIGLPLVYLIQGYVDFKKFFCLSCERVRSVIEGHEFHKEENGTAILKNVRGDIVLKDVSFAYYDNDPLKKKVTIFDKISFDIKGGSTVAFVGRSGCGKTTLLKMLSGQRSCKYGSITIDGIDYRDIDKSSLYDNISVINQSPHIFNMSIKDNMLCAKPDATMEEIESACKKAFILDEIKKMEAGFDTLLGENGIKLSGGQCQRLALARAFLRNTPLFILDEATSALDNIAQQAVMQAIKQMEGKHTVIIVAHRLSTIQDADRIFMVADKSIVASGTHKELISKNSDYRNLYLSDDDSDDNLITDEV